MRQVVAEGDVQVGPVVGGQCGQVGLLVGLGRRVVAHQRGEVPHRDDRVAGAQAAHQAGHVQPLVTVPVAVSETVVQVEAVDVGNDGGHESPQVSRLMLVQAIPSTLVRCGSRSWSLHHSLWITVVTLTAVPPRGFDPLA